MPRRRSSLPEPAAVGVSFHHGGKVYYFKPNGVTSQPGDHVLAKTERGVDIGEVVMLKHKVERLPDGKPLKPLVRRATRDDLLREDILRRRARESLRLCEGKIEEHNLPMKLISADYAFDGRRLTFFFSSDTRVDFRALVRDLAETFRCRIELRQIGVRDEAKMIGGLGPCGRPLCCAQWLRSFSPVGIRVAKDQGMSLNPAKISGVCDRLMCCLLYEHEAYTDLAERMPRVGDEVRGQGRAGKVVGVTLLREKVKVAFQGDEPADAVEVSAEDLRRSKGYWRLIGAPPASPFSPERSPKRSSGAPRSRTVERSSGRSRSSRTESAPETTGHSVVMREPKRRDATAEPAQAEEQPTEERREVREREPRRRSRSSRRRPRKRTDGQAPTETARTQEPGRGSDGPQKSEGEPSSSRRSSRRRGRRGKKPNAQQSAEGGDKTTPPSQSQRSGGQESSQGADASKNAETNRTSRRSRRRPRRNRDRAPDGGGSGTPSSGGQES